MRNSSDNPYKDLIYGVDYTVPLINNSSCVGINFDNAATTPPFKSVIDEVINFSPYYSSIHRGEGYKSKFSTFMYDNSRNVVKSFLNDHSNNMDVIYTKNCTEAINKLAGIMAANYKNTVVLSTSMEHHSNDLPWRKNFKVHYINVDEKGCLDINDLKNKLERYNGQVSLVTITGASNVTGIINNVHQIATLAHKYDAKILVDGAQLIPHDLFSIGTFNSADSIDFLAFSAHKMYAPFGTGVLLGPKNFFDSNCPDQVGGGTIDFVSHEKVIWTHSPEKDEAGSPNVIGAVALAASINQLCQIGMNNIYNYESYLTKYLTNRIKNLDSVVLYGDYDNLENKVSILPFNITGMHHGTVAKALSFEYGIAVRSGCFCAHPYLQQLLKIPDNLIEKLVLTPKDIQPGMVRVSFGIYNTIDEINIFLQALENIIKNKSYYNNKYGSSSLYQI